MTSAVCTELQRSLRHLEQLDTQKHAEVERQRYLANYLADLSSIVHLVKQTGSTSVTHKPTDGAISVTHKQVANTLHLHISPLPPRLSDIAHFLQIQVGSGLPDLLGHVGDSHVFRLQRSADSADRLQHSAESAEVAIDLPVTADISSVQVTVSLLVECPAVLRPLLPPDKHHAAVRLWRGVVSSRLWRGVVSSKERPCREYSSRRGHCVLEVLRERHAHSQLYNITLSEGAAARLQGAAASEEGARTCDNHVTRQTAGRQHVRKLSDGKWRIEKLSGDELLGVLCELEPGNHGNTQCNHGKTSDTVEMVTDTGKILDSVSIDSTLGDLHSCYLLLRNIEPSRCS